MEESIAHVHVLEAPFHADREYSYYIPTELWGKIRT